MAKANNKGDFFDDVKILEDMVFPGTHQFKDTAGFTTSSSSSYSSSYSSSSSNGGKPVVHRSSETFEEARDGNGDFAIKAGADRDGKLVQYDNVNGKEKYIFSVPDEGVSAEELLESFRGEDF